MPLTDEQEQDRVAVNLKDPGLAALLAWLIPGLGHLYQGRRAKAGLFFVCIMGTFLYGLYLGSDSRLGWARVVYFSWRSGEKRLAYLCQVGIGLPALPALWQWSLMSHGKRVWWDGFMAPPAPAVGNRDFDEFGQPTASTIQKQLHHYFELGTAFTMIAGLLNILAIYDAWDGPVISETGEKKKDDDQEDPPDDAPPKVSS